MCPLKHFFKLFWLKSSFVCFHNFYELSKERCIQRGDHELIAGSGTHSSWSQGKIPSHSCLWETLSLTPPNFRTTKGKKLHESKKHFKRVKSTGNLTHSQMQCTYWHPPQHRRLTQVRSWTWNPTTFSCRAVTEMISYNSSEQADHFTSGDLCKIRAWTHFFPSSGLSFRKKHASPGPSLLPMSMDIKHMSLRFWKVLHYLTSLLFVELLSKGSHLAKNF